MDNVKALVKRLREIAGNMVLQGMSRADAGTVCAAADALAPLAEPVEMPEEPLLYDLIFDDGLYLIGPWKNGRFVKASDYKTLRSALERALAQNKRLIELHKGLMAEADKRLDEATARAEASEKDMAVFHEAIVAMAEDGWLYHGVEGLSLAQEKCRRAYLIIKPQTLGSALDAAGRSGG